MPSSLRSTTLPTIVVLFALLLAHPLSGQRGERGNDSGEDDKPLPTVAEKVRGLVAREGFLPMWLDARRGTVWLELAPPGEDGLVAEAIYLVGLQRGLGSNPIGLDRGQMGPARLLRIRRLGPNVLFEVPNLRFRAETDNPAERRATADSFATSVLWGQKIGALDANGRALVDLRSFLIRDAHGVAATLRDTEQGTFELDPERSAVDLENCLVFPDNVELEAVVTFAGGEPGEHVRRTAPVAEAITLVQHIGLVRLPDDGYQPRAFDPRIGMYDVDFLDYAAGLDESNRRQWISRHRLHKTDPAAVRSKAVEPIVYYVDPGAPEPVRSALIEGAGWWAEAFEAAGFEDGYRVEVLPEGAHPLDARYNVIQWVHRSTRGWSYGSGITDPRTGEIIKGHVSLGSLRVRQDRLLFEGLAGTAKTGSGDADDPIEIALARIRQLSAHEVGHTLGITHNFAASTYADRASVMDYPAPLIGIDDQGRFDFSRAYGVGVGAWDVHTVRYGYSVFAPGTDETAGLEAIVREGTERGLVFLADHDARPAGAAEPRANLWDNGEDPVEAFDHSLRVRALALSRFGAHNVLPGTPLTLLEEVLAPVYFHHRYQLDAAVKVVGGRHYDYRLAGDGGQPVRTVDGVRQRRALDSILALLAPEALDVPESVLSLLAPRPFGWPRSREQLRHATTPTFDALGAAATAADQAVAGLLQPHRLNRVADQHRRDSSLPGVPEVVGALVDRAFGGGLPAARLAAVQRVVQRVVVDRMVLHADHPELAGEARSQLRHGLQTLESRLRDADTVTDLATLAQRADLLRAIGRYFARHDTATVAVPVPAADPPPGSPIGMPPMHFGGCEGHSWSGD